MKISAKALAENVLFALNVFIVFLLVFEDKLILPYWLQPIGRMHPMLLHFPIVLLMLGMLLEFFRFKPAYTGERLYQRFTSGLLLTGVLLSAITVIMGLFLSAEEGYEGSTLQWHKWTGVSIVFISSAIYWFRNAVWYKAPVARIGAVLTTLCLIVAGHYGAVLTHGDNFVLSPITPSEIKKVPVDQALLFKDVVMPIFSQKCLSCHNVEKAKGSLILADAESVFKGGKNGKLFVPGKPEISLMLERIHLPMDEKKHMPPKGKAQLTPDEIAVLSLWVKNNADLKWKVTDLPPQDSLRILSTRLLGPSGPAEEAFDFASADAGTISKLNNDYRVVYAVAKNSPALAVNIYNRSTFNSSLLKELNEIKGQIVSLDLNKMPIKDEDLKVIAGFENLRRLNLNFTDITEAGLKHLKSLKHLKEVSMFGTKASKNTGPVENDGVPLKLNTPRLATNSSIFRDSLIAVIEHAINGVQLRYTVDGSGPDSLSSPLYREALVFKEPVSLRIKAYKAGWKSSDVVTYFLFKSKYKPDSIRFLKAPNANYRHLSSTVLVDAELGDKNMIGGKWIGFLENDFEALLSFKKAVPLESVTLNIRNSEGAGFFPPEAMEVWGGPDPGHLRLLKMIKIPMQEEKAKKPQTKIVVQFESQEVHSVKIVAKTLKKLPNWHPRKGEPAWIMIDEMFLN